MFVFSGGGTRAVLVGLVVSDGQGSAQGEELNPQLLRLRKHQQHPQSLERLAARMPDKIRDDDMYSSQTRNLSTGQ